MNLLRHFTRWLRRKAAPSYLPAANPAPSLDTYRRHRVPTANDLLNELRNTAWACASINAAVCASFPPRLFVVNGPDQPPLHLRTRSLDLRTQRRLLAHAHSSASAIEEVVDHPLLTLLRQVNPIHNSFDLW